MLRLLAESVGACNVIEIALQKTGGKLTTFEYATSRVATARRHVQTAGFEALVTVVEGDAHTTVSRLTARRFRLHRCR